ncbi:MAG: glycogen/starch synthase [Paracoccaceae bacterium]
MRLPWHAWHPDHAEYHGNLSTLKVGLALADAITTVSPTYAEELMRPGIRDGSAGADRLARQGAVGDPERVDDTVWSPEKDDAIIPTRRLRWPRRPRTAPR